MNDTAPAARASSFHPDGDPDALAEMKSAVRDERRDITREAIVNCGRVLHARGATAIGDALVAYFDNPAAEPQTSEVDTLFADPAVQAWLRFLLRDLAAENMAAVARHCDNMPAMLERTTQRLNGAANRYVPGTGIAFQYLDLDPYIMAATPPSYDFQVALRTNGADAVGETDWALQADLVASALDMIERAWPELRREIGDFVQIVGYLPDAAFRSCSAARYHGVIYLGGMDASLLDYEESLVHESGHQILYRVAETSPLTRPGTPLTPDYTLPWSGSQRDLFGYFHAFYIYVLLVKYFWRRAQLPGHAAAEARKRAILILIGIRLAEPALTAADNLSDRAHAILAALIADMDSVEAAMIAADAAAGEAGLGEAG